MMSCRKFLLMTFVITCTGEARTEDNFAIHKRQRVPKDGTFAVQTKAESWKPAETAIIVCDMWDAHHCLNAVRRVEEMAPRMNQVLENARGRGALIIHAPSSCMAPYESYPGRKLAKEAPKATTLPQDIAQWCYKIPAEEKGKYPIDQSDGGEDDDLDEHRQWHEKLSGMGRNPKAPWKSQYDVLKIHDEDAISDSGVEIWNLLEQRKIKNVILLGVHTNMCVLGRPFGLRQMAKNGKNVVLMRDMTDTMYNPSKAPYVSHFQGTDLIIEHIEKFVCPTITSVDVLGGQMFKFKNDRRSVAILIGEDEYQTDKTLPEFARKELEPLGFKVTIVHSSKDDKNDFPGLIQAVAKADVVLVSIRRRTPPKAQLDAVHAHLAAGKPLVGIRTASHAFSLREKDKPLPEGLASWTTFDPEILGGNYTGHHGEGPKVAIKVVEGAAKNPILNGVDIGNLVGNGSLYKVSPLKTTAHPLLMGTIPGKDAEPVAWTNTPAPIKARVFYTSLGHIGDFEETAFRKLLVNALCWTVDYPIQAETKEDRK